MKKNLIATLFGISIKSIFFISTTLTLCMYSACSLDETPEPPNEHTYVLSFSVNGGSAVESQTLVSGQTATQPQAPTREGFAFQGWYRDENFNTEYDFSTPVTENITIYANWEAESQLRTVTIVRYYVTFLSLGTTLDVQRIGLDDDTVAIPDNPTRAGFVFGNWFTDEALTNVYNFSTTVTDDFNLYARWIPEDATIRRVTFNANGGRAVTSQVVVDGEAVLQTSVPTRERYVFSGWFTDNGTFNDEYDLNTPVRENITLHANWTPGYKITFNANRGTEVASQMVVVGGMVTVPSVPTREAYIFSGWFTDNETFNNEYDFNTPVRDNITLYANWMLNGYIVTFNTNGGYEVEEKAVVDGGIVNRPTNPTNEEHGGTFDRWYSNEDLTREYDFNAPVTENITLYARWEYMVTYDENTRAITGLNPALPDADVNLVIPANINGLMMDSIRNAAFYQNTRIVTLRIAEGIRYIGHSAFGFYDWSAREALVSRISGNLIIPNSVETIGDYAFYDCIGFTGHLIIPNSVETIGDYAFYDCIGFTGHLTIPNSVKIIGESAFNHCIRFSGLTLSNSLETISPEAFFCCSGFRGNLIIPNSIVTIGYAAFAICRGFTGRLVIPNSVVTIESSAFKECRGFTGLTIGNSLETIGPSAFCSCSGLRDHLVIPNSVVTIGSSAFESCYYLSSLTLGNSVETIGKHAFYRCSNFRGHLTIPNSVVTIEESAFLDCTGFSGGLTLGNSLETIGGGAFEKCSGLRGHLNIPNSVETIQGFAFLGCSGFRGNLIIPNSVETIGMYAFSRMTGIDSFIFEKSTPPTTIRRDIFSDINVGSLNIIVPNAMAVMTYRAVSNLSQYADRIRTL